MVAAVLNTKYKILIFIPSVAFYFVTFIFTMISQLFTNKNVEKFF